MSSPGNPAQVLIVEDNDPDVFLLEEALREHGILAHLQRCSDGEEALHALSQIDQAPYPDIIIIDLNLPKVTGLEILKHVRSLRQLDDVPVMILTSSQSKSDRMLSLKHGADAYIAKPPTLPEFLAAVGTGVRALLERSAAPPRGRLDPAICGHRRPRLHVRVFHPVRRSRGSRLRSPAAI
jgi:two-component system, chemotaxis family, response regulator Rcp1